ncbi:MAG: formyl transferase [Vicinamibacteria bacterium]|jgi:folate-dependent phosphoribosylglycinamide formyltransferase PurN
MRAIVLTSTMRRHCFVANTVSRLVDVVGVWQEAKSFQPLAYADTPDDAAVIERHFDARQASEDAFFADHETVHRAARSVPPGGCNHPAVLEAMRAARPGVVLVFGTGLLKRPLLDLFPDRVLNIHLGLSPYYRGAGTNFWPLVNGEPEYCGATIHFMDEGVDSGPIVEHVRPDIQAGDGPHEIGNKTIIAAAAALGRAAVALGRGPVASTPQGADGRVYRRADFSAAAVRRLYDRFERGMIADYLAHRAERDAALSLVTLERS